MPDHVSPLPTATLPRMAASSSSPSSRSAGRAAACSPTGSSTSPSATAIAQSTSVAGVAQRTGATIYYIEMCRDAGRPPVFALLPSQGDVDIVIAAELMEAGRAIMRGFVTPERTTLIASSHRIAAVSEKIEPGDGRASSAEGARGRRSRVEALHRLRHGEDRRRERRDDLGEPVRRAGRFRRAAVSARELRADDPRLRPRREGQPRGVRRRL